ncbi:MAG: hypothetical protein KDD58_13385 [Bdellovibrionales bacterium]|nr:hypothetical protein [Bdellovibrionales bacterium]
MLKKRLLILLVGVSLPLWVMAVPENGTYTLSSCNLNLQSIQNLQIHISPSTLNHIVFGSVFNENVNVPVLTNYGWVLTSKNIPVYGGGGHTLIGLKTLHDKLVQEGVSVIKANADTHFGELNAIQLIKNDKGELKYAMPAFYFEFKDEDGTFSVRFSSQMLAYKYLKKMKIEKKKYSQENGLSDDQPLTLNTPVSLYLIALFPENIKTTKQIIELLQQAINKSEANYYPSDNGFYYVDSFVTINNIDIKVRLVLDKNNNLVTFYPYHDLNGAPTIGDWSDKSYNPESFKVYFEELYSFVTSPVEYFKDAKLRQDLIQVSFLLLEDQINHHLHNNSTKAVINLMTNKQSKAILANFFKKWPTKKDRKSRIQLILETVKKLDNQMTPELRLQNINRAMLRFSLGLDIRN